MYEEVDSFVFVVRLISNISIAIAFPFQCIVFRILWINRKSAQYSSPFYLTVQVNCILNMLQTLVKLFVDVPSTTDTFREIFAAQANIVGKVLNFRSYYISMIIVSNLAYITLNRLNVFLHIDSSRKKPKLKSTMKKLFFIWLFWTIVCLPKIWPVEYRAIRFAAIDYNYQILPSQSSFQMFYLMFSIVHIFTVLVLIYVVYIVIGIKLYKAKHSLFKKSVVNATLAALMMSLGMMVCIVIIVADFVAGFFGHFILNQHYYYMVFNLGIDFNVFITPFSVILLTSDVRGKIRLSMSSKPIVTQHSVMPIHSNVKKSILSARF